MLFYHIWGCNTHQWTIPLSYLKGAVLQLAYRLGFDILEAAAASIHAAVFNNLQGRWRQEDKEKHKEEAIACSVKIADFSVSNPGVFWFTYV